MLSKNWKRIGLIILIIACLWNIVFKMVNKVSFRWCNKFCKAKNSINNKNRKIKITNILKINLQNKKKYVRIEKDFFN